MLQEQIRNIAIIAHVDHGKTTLVDQMLRASGAFREGQQVQERVLDSNDQERERGITILAKNISIEYRGIKINVIDTPGHADFGGEVERVLKMADGALLLVDAAEGPMPQTRFVLRHAIANGLQIMIVVNKIDRDGANAEEAMNSSLDLMMDLGATDDQLEFAMEHVVYASAVNGFARLDADGPDEGDMLPLLDMIVDSLPAPDVEPEGPLAMQCVTVDHSTYVGRIGIGRVYSGTIHAGERILVVKNDGSRTMAQVKQLFTFDYLGRKECDEVVAGDIGAVIAETREAIDQFIFESESISGDLAEELADYSNAFHTLVVSDATQEARDNATAKLEGLNGFMQQNYEALAEAVDPPEMGKFMDTLRKADDALELGLDFSRYLDAAEKEELEAQANNIDDKTADSLREYEAGFDDLISEISENGQFPNNLADELTDYKNALGTLSDFFSSKEERDAASAKLSGLDGFMRQNYDTLTGLVDPPDMLKFTEMLHEADAVLGLGLNFSQYLDAADREEREADKQKFLEDAEHYDDSIPGDAELAGILYDAKFNADGSINTDYEEQLKDLKDGNFSSLEHSGDREKTLAYTPAPDEMILTVHRWFEDKSCPGDWMYARMGDLADKVTAALRSSSV